MSFSLPAIALRLKPHLHACLAVQAPRFGRFRTARPAPVGGRQ